MADQDWPNGDRLGFLFPDELVEKYGLREGDVFTHVDDEEGIVLKAANTDLIERMRAAGAAEASYRVKLQDLSKLA